MPHDDSFEMTPEKEARMRRLLDGHIGEETPPPIAEKSLSDGEARMRRLLDGHIGEETPPPIAEKSLSDGEARMRRLLDEPGDDTQRPAGESQTATSGEQLELFADHDLRCRAAANGVTPEQQARYERILAAFSGTKSSGERPGRELILRQWRSRTRGHSL